MGTYSDFELVAVQGDNSILFWQRYENYEVMVDDDNLRDLIRSSEVRWYSWVDDMKDLSKEYPNTLFTVQRIREDNEISVYHFRNGVAENAEPSIEWLEPSESLLRTEPDPEAQDRLNRRNALETKAQELRALLEKVESEKREL